MARTEGEPADGPAHVVAELAVKRVLAEYCQLVDDGRFDELAQRFTEDGSFSFAAVSAAGRDGVRSWFEQNHTPDVRGKHLTTNVVVDVDRDRATAVSDFVFLGFRDGQLAPTIAGRYHDDLHRVDGNWLIHRREASAIRPPGGGTVGPESSGRNT